MKLADAIKQAENQITPAQPGKQVQDPYTIGIEYAESAMSLVGKTIYSKDANNKNTLTIVKWVGQNYVMQVNNSDDYRVTPVMWVISNLDKMVVK